MEKIVYVLWRHPDDSVAEFGRRLRGEVAARLIELGACGVQANIADEDVEPASRLRQGRSRPQMEGMLSVWVDTAIAGFRRPFDQVVQAGVDRMAGYLVTESQPLVNTLHPAKPGMRTHGFSQLAFLTRPPRLTHEAWLDIWQNAHTPVAIGTQSLFSYVQNVVVRALTHGAPALDAVVEECFPAAAMSDPQIFFDAAGDEEKFRCNMRAELDSCRRFIGFNEADRQFLIDVVPTSQYVIKPAAESGLGR